ncbi:hypothetical protein HA402_009181 [Bradysia odoriphaga]|nr:hypothetical protein HA402_009181 [Bradysia odoriphaga]
MGNNVTQGFHWQSGLKRDTVGIWMWPEIFTHDYESGDRVAIILLDTEGMFDDSSSCEAASSIFTLSTMLSSVQCFNVMHNIQADHLEHLRSVTDYGILASKGLAGKPFQKLMFLVRDWPNELETGYGYHDGFLVDEMGAVVNKDQTAHMSEMGRRIAESFDRVGVFLMPHPGMTVTQENECAGTLTDIYPEFLDCVKELSHHLFAPENLTLKQINGESLRAGDLVQYIQAYARVFNSNHLPETDTLFQATVEVMDSILINECVKFYRLALGRKIFRKHDGYSPEIVLSMHNHFMARATTMFQEKAKLGGQDKLAQLNDGIEKEFRFFNQENQKKLKLYPVKKKLFVASVLGAIVGSIFGPLGSLAGYCLSGSLALFSSKNDLEEIETKHAKQIEK